MIPKGWSKPDGQGISTLAVDTGAVSTLKGRRRRRAWCVPQVPDAWPRDWRSLLETWLRRGGEERRWDSLLKLAGHTRYALAEDLLQALLAGGWVELDERFVGGGWRKVGVQLVDSAALRHQLGLPDPEARRDAWRAARTSVQLPPELAPLLDELEKQPAERALKRLELLVALTHWRAQQCNGTWRDFAQWARGDTKAITESERHWLKDSLDMTAWGIAGHIPLLLLRAPIRLVLNGGRLDLNVLPGFIGLPPDLVNAVTVADGHVGAWRLVENRTSFERVSAEYGTRDGILWLPGYAPNWWKSCVTHLLTLLPAPARIACDPDPDGIAIALDAAQLFQNAGLEWSSWRMDAADLEALPRRRPLGDEDRARLDALAGMELPDELHRLTVWMREHGEKGEQEGLL